ncbi:hypothetical protein WDU94_011850 [Cyamophila willieti]
MEDLSFELNAPKNLKSKQTGSRKKFPELSSKVKIKDKENKKPTKSIKLWDPNEDDIRKFLNKKPTKTTSQLTKSKTVDTLKNGNAGVGTKKVVGDFSSKKETSNQVEKINVEKSKKTNVEKPKKEMVEKCKTGNTNKDAKSKGSAKSTLYKGYDSSNESYKMSTTYEFSGNSRDESENLSDDSLVKIFKSKLPTSAKIDRILTPRVNNVRALSSRNDKGDINPSKSKKLTFDGKDKPSAKPKSSQQKVLQDPKPFNKKRIIQDMGISGGFRNSVGFNVFATPLKTTQTKISTPTESENNGRRENMEKKMTKNEREKNYKGKKMDDYYFQSDNKGEKMTDINRHNDNERKKRSCVASKKAPLTFETNDDSDVDFDQVRIKGDAKQKDTKRGPKGISKHEFEKNSNENIGKVTQRGTKSTRRNPLTALSPAQHNSSLFSTISGGRNSGSNLSGSRNSSLFSSLSPSPRRNLRSSSLFSTISMESKESHDSSGSVYVSAADSPMSISNDVITDTRRKDNKKHIDIDPKLIENRKKIQVDHKSNSRKNVKNKNWIENESCDLTSAKVCGRSNFNNAKDKGHSNSKDKFHTSSFSPKMLRSRNNTNDKSSLYSSITSNESLAPANNKYLNNRGDPRKQNKSVDRKHGSMLESRNEADAKLLSQLALREENRSSSIISGIDKLNLTEDKSNLSEDRSILTENVKNNYIQNISNHREVSKDSSNLNETGNSVNMSHVDIKHSSKPSIHSSLFSSINSDSSKLADDKQPAVVTQPNAAEVISISSDSSFDIDADLAELEAAKSSGAAAAGILCKDWNNSNMNKDSKLSEGSKIVQDTKFSEDEMYGTRNDSGRSELEKNGHSASIGGTPVDGNSAFYSTFGNINLTTGVKILKAKHFFNSSDDRFSSISEPSCVESSVLTQKDPRRQINETIEARDSDLSQSNRSNEVLVKRLYTVDKSVNSGSLYPKINESIESTDFKTALGNLESELAYKTRETNPQSGGNETQPHQSHSEYSGGDKSSWVESSILPKTGRSLYPKLDGMKESSNFKTGLGFLTNGSDSKSGHIDSKLDVHRDLKTGLNGHEQTNGISHETKNQPKLLSNKSESSRTHKDLTESKSSGRNVLDDLFDKSKVFNGERWVSKTETEGSFQFKEPKLKENDTRVNGKNCKGDDPHADDLSSWGVNSRGNVKVKVDRYSLSFNFNKLIGPKPETSSAEQFSSDVKQINEVNKRKSFNRDLRKSIEIKRSIVISSDSDEDDSDDQIRVVNKGKRKQRILDSSEESEDSVGESSEGQGTEEEEEVRVGPKGTRKLLHGLTSDFNEILKINKKATAKSVPNTPKAAPPVRSLDKKPKGKAPKQFTPVPNTPLRTDKISKTNRLTFLSSLSVNIPDSYIPHPEAAVYKTKFKSKKEELARRLFHLYNKEVFGDRLPSDMPLEWNGRMRTTSGFCYNKRIRSLDPTKPDVRSARIALSKKILDTPDRLRDTLVHELCHAASWLIDGMRDGHGPNWKKWTIYAMQRFPELPPIKRCHDYKIDTKYVYRCSQCDYEFGRHSKSLNIERKVCGYCHGKFILLTNSRQGQTEQTTKRPPTQFALFVKENYARVKQENVGVKHGDVMKLLSQKFAQTKLNNG